MLHMDDKKSSNMKRKNIFISSVACERRDLDAQKIYSYLIKNNYKIVNDPKEADYIFLITCGFTHKTADIAFESIKKFREYDAELIVAGCIPETHKEKLDKIFDGKTISTKNIDKIDDIFTSRIIKFKDIDEENFMWQNFNKRNYLGFVKRVDSKVKFIRRFNEFIIRNVLIKILGDLFYKTFPFNRLIYDVNNYFILISRGCVHNCTYCIINKAIGPLKSKPPEKIVEEFNHGLSMGYKLFILEADDVGPYGLDIESSLPELLKKITNIKGDYSIEIRNTHPFWIIKYLSEIEKLVKTKKISSIFVSIQSGSNRILKLMGRPYTKENIVKIISKLKTINPDLTIGVDLMVGFPTETLEEFRETLDLFNLIDLDFGDIIPFSCHEKAKANKLEPKISNQEKKIRINEALKFVRKKNYFVWKFRDTGSLSFFAR